MKECPSCQNLVREAINECPHCGHDFASGGSAVKRTALGIPGILAGPPEASAKKEEEDRSRRTMFGFHAGALQGGGEDPSGDPLGLEASSSMSDDDRSSSEAVRSTISGGLPSIRAAQDASLSEASDEVSRTHISHPTLGAPVEEGGEEREETEEGSAAFGTLGTLVNRLRTDPSLRALAPPAEEQKESRSTVFGIPGIAGPGVSDTSEPAEPIQEFEDVHDSPTRMTPLSGIAKLPKNARARSKPRAVSLGDGTSSPSEIKARLRAALARHKSEADDDLTREQNVADLREQISANLKVATAKAPSEEPPAASGHDATRQHDANILRRYAEAAEVAAPGTSLGTEETSPDDSLEYVVAAHEPIEEGAPLTPPLSAELEASDPLAETKRVGPDKVSSRPAPPELAPASPAPAESAAAPPPRRGRALALLGAGLAIAAGVMSYVTGAHLAYLATSIGAALLGALAALALAPGGRRRALLLLCGSIAFLAGIGTIVTDQIWGGGVAFGGILMIAAGALALLSGRDP